MERDSKASAGRLAEVWNDTVDLRHLAWAIAIGIAVSVAGFYAASGWLRDKVASPELAHAYAMLAGLAGCVLAGVICARLFPPKREVSSTAPRTIQPGAPRCWPNWPRNPAAWARWRTCRPRWSRN